MSTGKQVANGITAKQKRPIVNFKPDNPKRQFMSKEQALEDNARMKRANEAAEAAKRAVLSEALDEQAPEKDLGKEGDSELTVARKRLAEIEERIQKKSTAALLKQKQKLEDVIEELESKE